MRKHLLLLFAMCFVQLMAFAGPRSYQQALKIAQQQAERLGISMDAMSPQPRMVQKTNGIDPAYYVIENGTNKGYTIVSADDRLPEIVGSTTPTTHCLKHTSSSSPPIRNLLKR